MSLYLKRIIFAACFCTFLSGIWAQKSAVFSPCFFDETYSAKSLQSVEKRISAVVAARKNVADGSENFGGDLRTIPVVVHVVHNGGAENISKAQIERQIEILNEDYGKLPGTPGDGSGMDTRVRFCLAKIDPQGRCTDGIVRLKTPLTVHQPVDRSVLKKLSFWDNARYLNIYIVKSISGNVGGYSSFPYSPPEEDGMVVRNDLFGDIGTAASASGRTTTHEIGHWFGLYHTFNGGCGQDTCSDGDYVCDTPPVANPNFSCNLSANSCSNDSPNLSDQVRNYMDYSPDACKNLFTNGQKVRITATLDSIRTLIWSPDNLSATGCDSTFVAPPTCPVAADFVTLTPKVCRGGKVYFIDRSLNRATSWQWLFPGGTPSVSILQNPTVAFDTLGTFSAMLVTANAVGSDTLFLENYIQVDEPGVGQSLPFSANFDDGIFPPSGMEIFNPDLGISWALDSLAVRSVPYSARIDNLININYGSRDELILPFLNLASANPDSALTLTFWWAYARSDANYSDELIVQISKDCGVNYSNILTKSGNSLITGPTQTTPFIPLASQWKKATANLAPHKTAQYAKIRFVNVTDGGNRLYLDDIQINGGLLTRAEEPTLGALPLRIFPNPATDRAELRSDDAWAEPIRVQAFDGLGRLLRNFGENSSDSLDLSGLQSGLLILKIESLGRTATLRLIKEND